MDQAKLWLQQAWQRRASWLVLLRPLSWLYGKLSHHQKRAYLSGKKPRYRAPVPVLVIGNISVGGSGKTPLIIALARHLVNQGIAVGVVSRGYGGSANRAMSVDQLSDPRVVGDEPCLIAQKTAVPVAIARQRKDAIVLLLRCHPKLQMIICDDGLQHYALWRDDEWIVVDVARGFGNQKLLPEGFLREPLSRLDGATVIYHYPTANYQGEPLTMHLVAGLPVPLSGKKRPLLPSMVYALTAIGHPPRFFASLERLGFSVIAKAHLDHHYFTMADLLSLTDHPVVVTEKDAVKLVHLKRQHSNHPIFANIWVLPVEMHLSAGVHRLATQFLSEHCL